MTPTLKDRNRCRWPDMPLTDAAARSICEASLKFLGAMFLTRPPGIAVPARAEYIGMCLLLRDGEDR